MVVKAKLLSDRADKRAGRVHGGGLDGDPLVHRGFPDAMKGNLQGDESPGANATVAGAIAPRSVARAGGGIERCYGTGARRKFAAALSRKRRRFWDVDLSNTAENRG